MFDSWCTKQVNDLQERLATMATESREILERRKKKGGEDGENLGKQSNGEVAGKSHVSPSQPTTQAFSSPPTPARAPPPAPTPAPTPPTVHVATPLQPVLLLRSQFQCEICRMKVETKAQVEYFVPLANKILFCANLWTQSVFEKSGESSFIGKARWSP